MTWLVLALVVVGAVILVAGLGSHSTKSTASTGSQPAAAQSTAAAGAIADVAAGRATLIDVRTPAEFAAGHANGAVNFDVAKIEAGQLPAVAKNAKIYVYCRTGVRAGMAQSILQRSGYTDVRVSAASGIGLPPADRPPDQELHVATDPGTTPIGVLAMSASSGAAHRTGCSHGSVAYP